MAGSRRAERRAGPRQGLAAAVAALAAAGYGLVWAMAAGGDGLARYDPTVAAWAAGLGLAGERTALLAVTALGGNLVLGGLAALAGLADWRRSRRPRPWMGLAFLATVVVGQALLTDAAKALSDRPRPGLLQLGDATGPAFPSGHVVAATAVPLAIALVLWRGRPPARLLAACAGAGGLALAVGATRVLLGAHWLTDVAGGMLLGVAWLAVCVLVFASPPLRPGGRAGEPGGTREAEPPVRSPRAP